MLKDIGTAETLDESNGAHAVSAANDQNGNGSDAVLPGKRGRKKRVSADASESAVSALDPAENSEKTRKKRGGSNGAGAPDKSSENAENALKDASASKASYSAKSADTFSKITEINKKSTAPDSRDTEDNDGEINIEEALEAILFAAGHPVSYATLSRVFEITPGKAKDMVFEYSLKYNNPTIPRGVILLTYPDACQLCTKNAYLHHIREALGLRRNGTLSASSIEVLAIVAYRQPVTRSYIDALRGVDSSYAVNNLLERGLIEPKGRLDAPGRPMLYGTSDDFLRCFGISSLDELPAVKNEEIKDFLDSKESENRPSETADSDSIENTPEDNISGDAANAENAPENGTESRTENDSGDDEISAEDDVVLD